MVFAYTDLDPGSRGNPDGMRVDKHGRLFALRAQRYVGLFNRDGKHLGPSQSAATLPGRPYEMLQHPMLPTSAWGGPDFSKLYITAGKTVSISAPPPHHRGQDRYLLCRRKRFMGFIFSLRKKLKKKKPATAVTQVDRRPTVRRGLVHTPSLQAIFLKMPTRKPEASTVRNEIE